MDTEQNNTAVKATLARLLGSDTFVTPQGMNNALAWLITMLKAEFHARPEPVEVVEVSMTKQAAILPCFPSPVEVSSPPCLMTARQCVRVGVFRPCLVSGFT